MSASYGGKLRDKSYGKKVTGIFFDLRELERGPAPPPGKGGALETSGGVRGGHLPPRETVANFLRRRGSYNRIHEAG